MRCLQKNISLMTRDTVTVIINMCQKSCLKMRESLERRLKVLLFSETVSVGINNWGGEEGRPRPLIGRYHHHHHHHHHHCHYFCCHYHQEGWWVHLLSWCRRASLNSQSRFKIMIITTATIVIIIIIIIVIIAGAGWPRLRASLGPCWLWGER